MQSGSCAAEQEHQSDSASHLRWTSALDATMTRELAWSEDLPAWARGLILFLLLGYLARSAIIRHRTSLRRSWLTALELIAGLGFTLALARPVWVTSASTAVGPRVAVLVDTSHRMRVGSGASTRADLAAHALKALETHFSGTRVSLFEFGRSTLRIKPSPGTVSRTRAPDEMRGTSDLSGALEQLESELGEKPGAIVVISDGRFSRPSAEAASDSFRLPRALRGTPLHVIDVGGKAPKDVSIVAVQSTGNAVAHQSFSLDVAVGCFGGISCSSLPVVVREHRKGDRPITIASGEVEWNHGELSNMSFSVTIERAGSHVLEVTVASPSGDEVPENDTRFVTLHVTRERLRLLHVAGRPTYDVRAMRQWLKSDSSVDLVSFFILRTDDDDTNTSEDSELALIPFPVDELFDEHLPSFDAVVLADIDADRYRVSRYLANLARYVETGGGLILVGGPSAFAGGGYADSPIERILPVTLARSGRPFDTLDFVPRATDVGNSTAILAPLRSVLGGGLPTMAGANSFGLARDKAVVLWEHPSRNALPIGTGSVSGSMPVLAVSEVGDGRVVALGVDGTHRLAFGPEAVRTAGRAYGALWDGLLGWVIRDPRFESTHGELLGECVAGSPARLRVALSGRVSGDLDVEVEQLGPGAEKRRRVTLQLKDQASVDVELGALDPGVYSAAIRLRNEPETRLDFACEAGGESLSDTRPDSERLQNLADTNNGRRVEPGRIGDLPVPPADEIHGARYARPILSNWIWSLLAACSIACHWFVRRSFGLR